MANEEQLAILKRGVETWNQWRAEHSGEKIDLAAAQLLEMDLNGAHLFETDLAGADLRRAGLSRVDLRRANLAGADLTEAILTWANLSGVLLFEANLSQANLSGAVLSGTNLSGAVLTGAVLTRARLFETVFGNTNLASVVGLESCRHAGPSTLDWRTLANSRELPFAFLRGVGLPDLLINLVPALRGDSLQFYACFISYSSTDQAFAERLHADLQNKGVRCWFAPEDLKIGERIRPGIDEAIRVHDKLLLILSEHSIRSQYVEQEVESALEKERQTGKTILFPVRLDDAVITAASGWPRLLRNTRNIGDMRAWKDHDTYQRAFERLLRDLRAEGAAPGS